jgi:hypothetical protein
MLNKLIGILFLLFFIILLFLPKNILKNIFSKFLHFNHINFDSFFKFFGSTRSTKSFVVDEHFQKTKALLVSDPTYSRGIMDPASVGFKGKEFRANLNIIDLITNKNFYYSQNYKSFNSSIFL